jgi:non-specific serine/threonine protein kinase/serine/threonine-protein kinase
MDVESRALLADRYELGPMLGRGGMAAVFRAKDTRLGRTVAVKLFEGGEHAPTARGRARFEAEARAAAAVAHPNVVTIYDTGVDDGAAFIVMECLTGRTLADEIASGAIPAERAVPLLTKLLDALGAAHDRGVLHRDVKPGNVLFTADGTPKLVDFGIARSDEGDDLTETGIVLGTPVYLAPERLAGDPATPQSDIYAMGVLAYEMLTGERPFRGTLTGALGAAVTRAMAPRPDDRYASAQEFADALTHPQTAIGMPTQPLRAQGPKTEVLPVVPAKVAKPSERPRERHRAWVFGVIAAIALLTGGLFAAQNRDNTPSRTPTRPAASTPQDVQQKIDALQRAVDR